MTGRCVPAGEGAGLWRPWWVAVSVGGVSLETNGAFLLQRPAPETRSVGHEANLSARRDGSR